MRRLKDVRINTEVKSKEEQEEEELIETLREQN